MELKHEFCAKFREEIKARGLAYIVKELLTSSSDKVPLKKQYLARECAKKKKFKIAFNKACESVRTSGLCFRPALSALQREISGDQQ